MSTQYIATLWDATCCARLTTMLRRVATCWVLLAQIWPFSNFSQQDPICRNTSQQGGQTRATRSVLPRGFSRKRETFRNLHCFSTKTFSKTEQNRLFTLLMKSYLSSSCLR